MKEKGNAAGGAALYRASKVLAERAIVDFVEKHKGEIGWDATRILPVWVRSAHIHRETLPFSDQYIVQIFGVSLSVLIKP